LIGPPLKTIATDEDIEAALSEALKSHSVKQAAAEVSARFNLPKRDMYQKALALKDG
jgi:16S rRNA (cytidine1402-2'-O)-methyltransferase